MSDELQDTPQDLFNKSYKKFESEYLRCAASSQHERCETSWSETCIEKDLSIYEDSMHVLLQFYMNHFKDPAVIEILLFDFSHLVNNENLRFIIGTILVLIHEHLSYMIDQELYTWRFVIFNWLCCFENSLHDPIHDPDVFTNFKMMAKIFRRINTDSELITYIKDLESYATDAYYDTYDC